LTPLVVHSAYSLLWGVPTPRRLVESAAEAGIHALALTDRNGLYGLPVFLRECRELGVRPIVGAELAAGWGRVVVIVRDGTGFSRLSRLLSERAGLLNDAKLSAVAHPFISWMGAFDGVRATGMSLAGAESKRAESRVGAESAAGSEVDAMLMRELLNLASMADPGVFLLSDSAEFLRKAPPSSWVFTLLSTAYENRWGEVLRLGHPPVLSPEISFLEAKRARSPASSYCDRREMHRTRTAGLCAVSGNRDFFACVRLCRRSAPRLPAARLFPEP